MSIFTRDQPVLRRWPSHVALGLTVACAFLGTSACSSGSDQESKTKTLSSASSSADKDSESSPSNDPQAIYDTWKAYQKALLTKDSAAAADLVTEETIAYYGNVRDDTLDMGAAELRKQSAIDQAAILSMRIIMPAKALRAATPREVFEFAVTNDFVDSSPVKRLSLARAKIAGREARASVMMNGKYAGLKISLAHEGGHWRLNIMDVVRPGELLITSEARKNGMSVAELVELGIIAEYGEAKTKAAYKPLGRS